MKIPLHIAEKLLLLASGERLAGSSLKHAAVVKMMDDGVIQQVIQGRSKSLFYLADRIQFPVYLKNHFGIAHLPAYIDHLKKEDTTRAEAVEVSSGSKLKAVRTFKGFLVNSRLLCLHS
jgi:hypothetical protein